MAQEPKASTLSVIAPVTTQNAPEQRTEGNCALVNNYNWDTRTAYAVCMAESGGNPLAYGDGGTAYPSIGLMQIRTLPGRPPKDQLEDPQFNMQYAYNMWQSQGFQPWSAWSTGAYLRFM